MPNTTMKDHRSLFRQLLAGLYDAVLITDPSGHLLELNPRAKEFFQYETDEVMDRPVGRFIPGVTPEIVERIRAGLDQARHMMLDANCLRKDGSVFPAEVSAAAVTSPSSAPGRPPTRSRRPPSSHGRRTAAAGA